MNGSPITAILLLSIAMACAACDRRESTGTSDVSRKGQGEIPETARDVRETSTAPSIPNSDTASPPPEGQPQPPSPSSDTQASSAPDPTTERDDGDTLHRP